MYKLNDIKQIHLEITQNCQASCPMCDRNQNGGALNPHIKLNELYLKDCHKIFEREFIQQLETMYMCGNLGDPILAKDTLDVFNYFRSNNSTMWLSMNTNGGARNQQWWKNLANVLKNPAAVIFSVDGLADTNHLYRQGVVWDIVEQNMRTFIEAGGRARWDFLIFEHNQHQIDEARALAEKWGVERFVAKKTGRFVTAKVETKEKHQAINRKGYKTTVLRKPKRQHRNAAVESINRIISRYGSMDYYYDSVPIQCKVKDQGNLFITAEGLVLPCCWTAGRMYKWWHKDPKIEQIWEHIEAVGGKDAINAKIHSLKSVFDTKIFNIIEASWHKPSCALGKLKVCAVKCGVEFDPFGAQYK